MDNAPIQKLRELPTDLVPMGWEFALSASQLARHVPGARYEVVYERRFEPGVDDDAPGYRVADHFQVQAYSWKSCRPLPEGSPIRKLPKF